MNLRSLPIDDKEFYRRAKKTKDCIIKAMNSQANHAAIQNIQNIFRDNHDKLYHWASDRKIPADNNFAERELRPLIIARKLSFGSQSNEGAKTREILMSVLITLKKRTNGKTADRFKYLLDEYAANSFIDIYKILFPADSS